MQNHALPARTFALLAHSLLKALSVGAGLLLATSSQAADWDISEDIFDAAQGGVQVKGWLSADENPDVQLGGYACRGCQNDRPFIYLYLPEGHPGEEAYPITVNGRQIMVQGESGDSPDTVTDQIPVETADVDWWASQVVHDIPLTVSLDRQVWHFSNHNGHRFVR